MLPAGNTGTKLQKGMVITINRDYTYHSYTQSLCNNCDKLVDAKIVYNDKQVNIIKSCPVCGEQTELLEENAEYFLSKARYDRSGTMSTVQTRLNKGCPYDCGLCPSHDQHSCIGLIEITQNCNLACEMCFARSGGDHRDLSVAKIGEMMDFYMSAENGEAEILQISGGEPTLHSDILEILRMGKAKGFKYVMLNTNGIRIAEDEEFVKALAELRGGFEVYLQFDGLEDDVYQKLRHSNLAAVKRKAIRNLEKYKIPTTLVATVVHGGNDNRLGELLAYGMKKNCVRGVNLQPVSFYGGEKTSPRITLSGILERIEQQTNGMIRLGDFIPLPCNVERVAITYLFKGKQGFTPITRDRDLSRFRGEIGNTFVFTIEDTLKNFSEDSKIFNVCACCDFINDIKKHLPADFILKSKEDKMSFVDENTFRISVTSFVDRYNFDIKSMQKECVHIITPDLKRIPFSAYNIVHRADYDKYYL